MNKQVKVEELKYIEIGKNQRERKFKEKYLHRKKKTG